MQRARPTMISPAGMWADREQQPGQREHDSRADHPVEHQRRDQHPPVPGDRSELVVADLGQHRVHHHQQPDEDRQRSARGHLDGVEMPVQTRDGPTKADAAPIARMIQKGSKRSRNESRAMTRRSLRRDTLGRSETISLMTRRRPRTRSAPREIWRRSGLHRRISSTSCCHRDSAVPRSGGWRSTQLPRARSSEAAARHLRVGEDRVDLPRLAAGSVHPNFVLERVATDGWFAPPWPCRGRHVQDDPCAAVTSSQLTTSTPRWLSDPGAWSASSIRTSLSGGSATAKFV